LFWRRISRDISGLNAASWLFGHAFVLLFDLKIRKSGYFAEEPGKSIQV